MVWDHGENDNEKIPGTLPPILLFLGIGLPSFITLSHELFTHFFLYFQVETSLDRAALRCTTFTERTLQGLTQTDYIDMLPRVNPTRDRPEWALN